MDKRTILDKIFADKKEEVETQKSLKSLRDLEKEIAQSPTALNFSGSIWDDRVCLIAEIKKASPSAGILSKTFNVESLAKIYAENGASAISVLTESKYFNGGINDLVAAKEIALKFGIPILRKDFVYDEYQLYETKAYRGDAVLLIASMLETNTLKNLIKEAQNIWLQCLVEVHNSAELAAALDCGAEIIGINHRNLKTFEVDLAISEQLVPLIPKGKLIVAESGIKDRNTVTRLASLGINAILVGEAIITATDRASKIKDLVNVKIHKR
ncbi:MAG: indole-3-glycerol phosphate synthase [Dehalococcoidia bacterium]|nr:indole-3-glycerol phosphate synthase [Dehalococcoidia bacterium]